MSVSAAERLTTTAGGPPPAFGAEEWPIAAGMLQFGPLTRSGGPTVDAPASEWGALLSPIADEGFTAVELSNRWLDLTKLPADRIAEVAATCARLGLAIPGYIVVARSVLDPVHGPANLRYTHDSIDAAAEVGAAVLCLGLHAVSLAPGEGPQWFWTVPGGTFGDAADTRQRLVAMFGELGRHAADRGIEISLEMYPGTQVGTAEGSVRLIEDIGHEAVGLNPDLGNLIRVQGPVEDWQEVVVRTLPVTNYWHVKSYSRAEVPETGLVVTHPATLEEGVIDYRKALAYALSTGFAGTIVTEHYGGDGLGVSATNREYLRRLLRSAIRIPA
jgi:sugar phosphate isomerase/epimerase